MNNVRHSNLANQLEANPDLFADMDEALLREVILEFHQGKLNEAESAKISVLIQSDNHAQTILDNIKASEHYAASPNGKAWLDGLLVRVMAETPVASAPPKMAFFTHFVSWWNNLRQSVGDPSFTSAIPLGAATQPEPIQGYVGEDDAVFYRISNDEQGKAELGLETADADWTKLCVTLGDWSGEVSLEAVGSQWTAFILLPLPLSSYEGQKPLIRRLS